MPKGLGLSYQRPELEQSILLPQTIIAQIDDTHKRAHKPQDQTDIIFTELLDEFKKLSTTTSSELKHHGDAIQHISDRQSRDHYHQNRSRDFSRRRDFYNTNARQNDHSLSCDRNQTRHFTNTNNR